MMTKDSPVLREYSAAVSDSVKEFVLRLEAAERKPVKSLSLAEVLSLYDWAVDCGGDLLRMRASAFAEPRNYNAALVQVEMRYEKERSEIKKMCAGEKDTAFRDFQTAKGVVTRAAEGDYSDLCKMYEKRKGDFEKMEVPMPRAPSFSEAIVSSDVVVDFYQALSDFDRQTVTIKHSVGVYAAIYVVASVFLGLLLENLAIGFIVGLVFPVVVYVLFIGSQAKLEKLAPALAVNRAQIQKRMEDKIKPFSKRLESRCEELDATLAKELEKLDGWKSSVLNDKKSDHESVMFQLKQSTSSLDAELLGLFDRFKKLEAAWQTENRQSVAPFFEKPLDWAVPAPRLLRLGSLSLTAERLIKMAS